MRARFETRDHDRPQDGAGSDASEAGTVAQEVSLRDRYRILVVQNSVSVPPALMNIFLNNAQELRSGWKFAVYSVLFLIIWVASCIAYMMYLAKSKFSWFKI